MKKINETRGTVPFMAFQSRCAMHNYWSSEPGLAWSLMWNRVSRVPRLKTSYPSNATDVKRDDIWNGTTYGRRTWWCQAPFSHEHRIRRTIDCVVNHEILSVSHSPKAHVHVSSVACWAYEQLWKKARSQTWKKHICRAQWISVSVVIITPAHSSAGW